MLVGLLSSCWGAVLLATARTGTDKPVERPDVHLLGYSLKPFLGFYSNLCLDTCQHLPCAKNTQRYRDEEAKPRVPWNSSKEPHR